jgi:tetratricopeptide (TPR) repeat protein
MQRTFSTNELAELCGLPVPVVKRWIQARLLQPMRGSEECFPFRAIGIVRTLAEFWRSGWSAPRIARAWQLAQTVVDDPEAALSGLIASIGNKRITVRAPDGRLIEPSGQMLFDFSAAVEAQPLPQLRGSQDWFAIGAEAEAAGRVEDAVRAYEHAVPSSSAETHFNLGNCYYELRRRQEAMEQFLAAIALSPEYAEAWNNLGIVRGELGDCEGSVDALTQALEAVPHYADAHFNLAEALAVVGDLESARKHWRAYLTFDPNSRWADQARRRLRVKSRL